jgi:branched-chain amino acid transport system ATP-binding protein
VVHQLFMTLMRLKKAGLTILLVEQNVHLALSVSDYAYVIAGGDSLLKGHPRYSRRCPRSVGRI